MNLAIADPPYLGRADRWYGQGRGMDRHPSVRRTDHKPDQHPDARIWDDPSTHVALVERLAEEFDGWALAATPSSIPVLLDAAPRRTRVAAWVRPNSMPSGSRVTPSWEPVLFFIPEGRRDRSSGDVMRDVLVSPIRARGFVGSKPKAWTMFVLDLLGYDPSTDSVADLFPGSGAVAEVVSGLLPTPMWGARS